jgi:hypothetical protein
MKESVELVKESKLVQFYWLTRVEQHGLMDKYAHSD